MAMTMSMFLATEQKYLYQIGELVSAGGRDLQ